MSCDHIRFMKITRSICSSQKLKGGGYCLKSHRDKRAHSSKESHRAKRLTNSVDVHNGVGHACKEKDLEGNRNKTTR